MSLSTYWVEDALSPLTDLPGFDVVIDWEVSDGMAMTVTTAVYGRQT